jgi:hypothetical protein
MRHDLASMKQRLHALEKKSAEEGIVLTEAQVQALISSRFFSLTNCWAGSASYGFRNFENYHLRVRVLCG